MLNQKILINERLVIKNPSEWLKDKIIKSNTFPNPKFYEAEKHGRYIGDIPRQIQTFHIDGEDLVVERGYYHEFINLINENHLQIDLEKSIQSPFIAYHSLNGISLRPYQINALEKASQYDEGIIVAPTGSGKTILGLDLIRRKQTRSLILVHTKELAMQWISQIRNVLGISPGFIGDGQWLFGEKITVALVQTLNRKKEACEELTKRIGLILCDECHHAPALMFSKVIGMFPCKFRYGLSATPSRRDGLDFIIFRVIGCEIARISRSEVENVGSIVPILVKAINTHFDPGIVNSWSDFVTSLNHPYRNLLLINLIPENRSCLILVDRISHAIQLSEMLKMRKTDHVVAYGSLPTEDRSTLLERLKESRIAIGTTGILGEGLDVSHWDTLIMGSPISSSTKLLQAIGRIARPFKSKNIGIVYDLKDDCGLAVHSQKQRFEIYKKHAIQFNLEWENEKSRSTGINRLIIDKKDMSNGRAYIIGG